MTEVNIFAHRDKLVGLVPDSFASVLPEIKGFLSMAGESFCSELYGLCEGITKDERHVVFSALVDDLFLVTHDRVDQHPPGSSTTEFTSQMLLTAAHAAPVIVAFNLLDNPALRMKFQIDRHFRRLLILAGTIMNLTGADVIVTGIPDMHRNNPAILSGALAALVLEERQSYPAELIRHLGAHWRELAPYRSVMSQIPNFGVKEAIHLVSEGPSALLGGTL